MIDHKSKMKIKRLQTPNTFVIRSHLYNHEELFQFLEKNIPWHVMEWSRNRNLPRKICHDVNTPSYVQSKMHELITCIVEDINRHRHLISPSIPVLRNDNYNFFCNYYETEKDYTPFHEDNYGGAVISFSFGASRRFEFKHKQTGEIEGFDLHSGDILYFDKSVNTQYKHSVPRLTKKMGPRVNITFFLK